MDDSEEFLKDTAAAKTPAATPPAPPAKGGAKATTRKTESAKAPSLVRKVYHRFGSEQVPSTLPVSTQMCPPITKRKFAIYQLLSFKNKKGERARDARVVEGDNQIEPQPYELVPTYTIYDRFESDLANRDKIISFIDGTETFYYENPLSGTKEPRVRPKIVTPYFIQGERIVDIEAKYMQYLWWELHPRNQSNKYHDTRKKPLFRRVDLDHINPNTELVKYTLKTQAHLRVDKILDNRKLVDLATALNIHSGLPPTDMRLELHRLIEHNPEAVLYAEGDPTATTRLSIHKAMDLGIIDYIADVQQFFFTSESDQPLHLVAAGADPVEDLAKFLVSEEGDEKYQELLEVLQYWK